MMTYSTLAEVPTELLERQLDILERLRDRGDFEDVDAYKFYYDSGIPLVTDEDPDYVLWDYNVEVLAVLEELMSRDVQR